MLIKNGIGLLLISYMIRVFRCFHLSRQTKKISKVLVSVFFIFFFTHGVKQTLSNYQQAQKTNMEVLTQQPLPKPYHMLVDVRKAMYIYEDMDLKMQ